jgi:extradiol dioxygenase family protein
MFSHRNGGHMTKQAQRIKQGKVQDVRVEYLPNGKSIVTPLSDWRAITPQDMVQWAAKAKSARAA